MKAFTFSFFLLLIIVSGFAQTTGTIKGKVTDSKTGEALPFCNVFINNTTLSTVTDIDGNFTLIDIPEEMLKSAFLLSAIKQSKNPFLSSPAVNLF